MPTALKIARGKPGHHAINRDEPKPDPLAPPPPKFLSKSALQRWNEVAPVLEKLGLLTEIDGGALAQYCTVWARWKEAEEKLAQFGLVLKSPNGHLVQSPYVSMANKALALVTRLEEQFGMTPSSRSRVKVPKKGEANQKQRQRFFGLTGAKITDAKV